MKPVSTIPIPDELEGKRIVPFDTLRKIAFDTNAPQHLRGIQKKKNLDLSDVISPNRYIVHSPDGVVRAPTLHAKNYDFQKCLRYVTDAFIASYMTSHKPMTNVTYITLDSVQDTFY